MHMLTEQDRYRLQPFEPIIASNLQIEAWVERLNKRRVQIQLKLRDEQHQVTWPPHHGSQTRAEYLEKSTCFEIFIQQADHANYVNVQLTPSGLWNAYRFDQYRQPKQVPPRHEQHIRIEQLLIEHHRISLVLDLAQLYPRRSRIHIGLAAILAHRQDLHTDWSLQHSAASADPHCAEDWRTQLSLLD